MTDTIHNGLVIRPGDTLIVALDPLATPHAAEVCRQQLRDRFPDIAIVIVAANALAAYRPGGGEP